MATLTPTASRPLVRITLIQQADPEIQIGIFASIRSESNFDHDLIAQ
jgi:hypothetical protein